VPIEANELTAVGQITTGVRAVLSHAWVYDACQWLMGGRTGRTDFSRQVRAVAGTRVLDIGCGTGELLAYLPPAIEYLGYDVSPEYIATARPRFPRAEFVCGLLNLNDVAARAPFDIVVASALLHHLDDEGVRSLMPVVRQALRSGGRFVSIDPVRVPRQNRVARFLIEHDRGLNVRTPEQYLDLVRPAFDEVHGLLRHRRWIPYTHWIMEGTIGGHRRS